MPMIFSRIIEFLKNIFIESFLVALPLYRIMIPMIILVKILREMGFVEILGQWLAPLMSVVGLPGSMGLVWGATMLGGFFPGIIIFADLASSEVLTVGQVTVLSSLMLIAHSLPIELQIANKAGSRWISMGIIRILGALVYGMILNQIFKWGNWLTERSVLLWHPKTELQDLQGWILEQVKALIIMYLVLFLLLQLMKFRDLIGLNKFLEIILNPILNKIGIGREATNITLIGITIGIAYGGALIIKESHAGRIPARDIFFSLVLMGLFHSVIEDTLIMMLLGGSIWGLLFGRMFFAFVIVWMLVRFFSLMPEQKFKKFFFKSKSLI
tara:strand:+ start:1746 stop:2726 length:981 start_codon:yes stop_codon:yes gene_type:complete